MQQFLAFVVENALAGNPDLLKETIVGVEVFGRDPGYDPKSDSVVRTEASRLRSKLEQYYSTEGASEPIIIRIAKGGYFPVFELGVNRSSPEAKVIAETLAAQTLLEPASQILPVQQNWWLSGRKWLPIGLATVVGILGFAGWFFFSKEGPSPRLRIVPLTGNAGSEITPALSPDGKQIAYAWKKEGGDFDIYVKLIDHGDPVRLTNDPGHDVSPSWSPNGKQIGFLRATPSGTDVVVMPALGGGEKVILTLRGWLDRWQSYGPQNWGKTGPAWSKEGNALIVGDGRNNSDNGLFEAGLDGSETRLSQAPKGELDFSPSVSPNGKLVAFVRGIPGNGDIYVLRIGKGSPRRLTFDHLDVNGITWWDDDTILFGSNRGGSMGLWRITLSKGERRLMPFVVEFGAHSPSRSARGEWLAFVVSTAEQSIWRRSLAEGATTLPAEKFIFSSGQDHSPQYSPDGTRIAFISDRSGASEIWVGLSDGSHLRRLTNFGGAPVGSPKWSPDGEWLVFDARAGRFSAIWKANVRANTAPERINNSNCDEIIPSWSNDSAWIYFVSDRTGDGKLWKQNVQSGRTILVSDIIGLDVTESKDGRFLYYERINGNIWRVPKDGGAGMAVPQLANTRTARNWALTTEGIYFANRLAKPPSLGFLRFEPPSVSNLGQIAGGMVEGTHSLAVSPDGRWLLYAQQELHHSNIMIAHQPR